jgi:hypothetical protein
VSACYGIGKNEFNKRCIKLHSLLRKLLRCCFSGFEQKHTLMTRKSFPLELEVFSRAGVSSTFLAPLQNAIAMARIIAQMCCDCGNATSIHELA